jgi:hypothetical protein
MAHSPLCPMNIVPQSVNAYSTVCHISIVPLPEYLITYTGCRINIAFIGCPIKRVK